jgi:hypothetical protein
MRPNSEKEASMIYALIGYAHAVLAQRLGAIRSLVGGERGQGTVEYVGLILLVSLLMVGMVAAMKGFNRDRCKTGYYSEIRRSSDLSAIPSSAASSATIAAAAAGSSVRSNMTVIRAGPVP